MVDFLFLSLFLHIDDEVDAEVGNTSEQVEVGGPVTSIINTIIIYCKSTGPAREHFLRTFSWVSAFFMFMVWRNIIHFTAWA
jgi:hypothetical protein